MAMAAGRATLELLDDGAFNRLTATATRLADGLSKAFASAGLISILPRVGSLLGLYFSDGSPDDRSFDGGAPTDFDEAKVLADNGWYPKVFHALLERGVALAPGAYEALFPSLAHDDAVVDETIEIAAAAAAAVSLG